MLINDGGNGTKARFQIAALFLVAAGVGVGCGSVSQTTGDAGLAGGSGGAAGAAGGSAGAAAGSSGGSAGSTSGSAGSTGGSAGAVGSAGTHGGADGGAGTGGKDGGADGSVPLGYCDQSSDCTSRSKGNCSCTQTCVAKTDPVPAPPPYSCAFACPLIVLDCGCVNHQCTAGATTAASP